MRASAAKRPNADETVSGGTSRRALRRQLDALLRGALIARSPEGPHASQRG